ncbi:Hypothetical predicted protein [Mytilus galloprovincialis]|uniref:B box-type domain-containing protein n=1 Tax=Mytilus galloprovincialis TaxID=29158 RepID=A0A8B6FMH9_MYTGA|nr:Hypothetical predicted protein [Mytilus galloprovincialis]
MAAKILTAYAIYFYSFRMVDSKLYAGCQRLNEDIKAESWCSNCSEFVCQSCAKAHERMCPIHKNCKPIISIEKAARSVKDGTAISDVERRLDNLSKVTDSILGKTETTLDDLKKSRNNIKKRVTEIKQRVITH